MRELNQEEISIVGGAYMGAPDIIKTTAIAAIGISMITAVSYEGAAVLPIIFVAGVAILGICVC